jgi:hypothetical protein
VPLIFVSSLKWRAGVQISLKHDSSVRSLNAMDIKHDK